MTNTSEQHALVTLIRRAVNPDAVQSFRDLPFYVQRFVGLLIASLAGAHQVARPQDGVPEAWRASAREAYAIIGVQCPHDLVWRDECSAYECRTCHVLVVPRPKPVQPGVPVIIGARARSVLRDTTMPHLHSALWMAPDDRPDWRFLKPPPPMRLVDAGQMPSLDEAFETVDLEVRRYVQPVHERPRLPDRWKHDLIWGTRWHDGKAYRVKRVLVPRR